MYKEFINVSFNYQSMIGSYLFNIKKTQKQRKEREKKGKNPQKVFRYFFEPFQLEPADRGSGSAIFLFCFGPSALIIKMDQENNDFG